MSIYGIICLTIILILVAVNCVLPSIVLKKIASAKYGITAPFPNDLFQKIFINQMDCPQKYIIKEHCLDIKKCENNIFKGLPCKDEPEVERFNWSICNVIIESCELGLFEEQMCLSIKRIGRCDLEGYTFANTTTYTIVKIIIYA
jgi:hypothetical protein